MPSMTGEFICPHCQQTLHVESAQPEQMILCPACNGEFTLPAIEVEPNEAENTPPAEELDGLRIRQLALMKRAAYRGKSYAIIAACLCTVAVAQLGVMIVRELLAVGWDLWVSGYVIAVIASLCGAWYFTGKALRIQDEIARSLVSNNAQPTPDFSSLGDGSQQIRNLEGMK